MSLTFWIVIFSVLPGFMAAVLAYWATHRWRWVTILWLLVCAEIGGMALVTRLAGQHYLQLRDLYGSRMPGGFLHEYGELASDADTIAILATSLLLWINGIALVGLIGEKWVEHRRRVAGVQE